MFVLPSYHSFFRDWVVSIFVASCRKSFAIVILNKNLQEFFLNSKQELGHDSDQLDCIDFKADRAIEVFSSSSYLVMNEIIVKNSSSSRSRSRSLSNIVYCIPDIIPSVKTGQNTLTATDFYQIMCLLSFDAKMDTKIFQHLNLFDYIFQNLIITKATFQRVERQLSGGNA